MTKVNKIIEPFFWRTLELLDPVELDDRYEEHEFWNKISERDLKRFHEFRLYREMRAE